MPKLKRKLRLNNQSHVLPMDAPASTESSELSLFTQSVRLEKNPLGESRHFTGPHCSFESPVATVTNLNHRLFFYRLVQAKSDVAISAQSLDERRERKRTALEFRNCYHFVSRYQYRHTTQPAKVRLTLNKRSKFFFFVKTLKSHSWYHGSIPRIEAEKTLRSLSEGSFLVRNCESSRNDFSLSLK